MSTIETTSEAGRATALPRGVRLAVVAIIGFLFVGASYLYAVRGVALLFDLATGLNGALCF